ncbi:MAG TPA: MBL fold metallo-hydrolase [Hyalangium sp.]|nr:MBL fold metallo-hydrolase [Hyalangium sp.]
MQRHPDGITAIDTEYLHPGLAAAHVIAHEGRAAFVDTGTTHSVPRLLAALDELGIARDAVDYVILTHVHLDHAGGAGRLMQALPQARAVLHPRGAPHMIDPTKLIAGSMAVYGEDIYRELYGELVPIPADRIVTTQDGQRLSLAGRELQFVHTPGHALHHHAIVDLAHRSIFTGDTFGLSYRELDTENGAFIVPTTTPTQFDPEQLVASMDRLLGYEPQALYLTHYSRVTEVPRLAELLKLQIRQFVTIARSHRDNENRHDAISADMRSLWLELLRRHGCTLPGARIDEVLGTDLELNTQGLIAWLDRERKG